MLTVLIDGDNAEVEARDLRARLAQDSPSEVDVQRAVDPIALFSVATGTIATVDIIWNWWNARPRSNLTARIAAADGTVVDLNNASRDDIVDVIEKLNEPAG